MFKHSFSDCVYAGMMAIGCIVALPIIVLCLPVAIIGWVALRVWDGE